MNKIKFSLFSHGDTSSMVIFVTSYYSCMMKNRSGYLTVENLRWKGERVYCIGHVRDMWGEPKELVYVSEVVV
jgi:hypothetical protein